MAAAPGQEVRRRRGEVEARRERGVRAQARDVDLTPISDRGGKPPALDVRPITAGDVLRQLATALDGNALRGN